MTRYAGLCALLCLPGCHALSCAVDGFWKGWSEAPPPPGTPGVPFYLDPTFWTWAVGGVGAVVSAKTAHHVVRRRRKAQKAATASTT